MSLFRFHAVHLLSLLECNQAFEWSCDRTSGQTSTRENGLYNDNGAEMN